MTIIKRILLWVLIYSILNIANHLIYTKIPYRKIVQSKDLSEYKKYIIIAENAHTGTGWSIYGDEVEMLDSPKDILLLNDIIKIKVDDSLTYYGKLVCSAEYLGEEYSKEAKDIVKKYYILDWQFMSPILRHGWLPDFCYQQKYLSIWDKYNFNLEDNVR